MERLEAIWWAEIRDPATELLKVLSEELDKQLADVEVHVSPKGPKDVRGDKWVGYHLWLMRRNRNIAHIYLTIRWDPEGGEEEIYISLDIIGLRRKTPLFRYWTMENPEGETLRRNLRIWKDRTVFEYFMPRIDPAVREYVDQAPQDWLPPKR